MKRRKRSHMTREDALEALAEIAKRVVRAGNSSGAGMFARTRGIDLHAPDGHLTVQFLVKGGFGSNEEVFEAIRVLSGCLLTKDGKSLAKCPEAWKE